MSLKHFHLVFVNAAFLLSAWFCWWSWKEYRGGGAWEYLAYAIGAGVVMLALLGYEVWFFGKTKRLDLD